MSEEAAGSLSGKSAMARLNRAGVNSYKAIISFWPIVVATIVFYVLELGDGHGNEILDAGTWPSAFDFHSCQLNGKFGNCAAICSFDQTIRILSTCAAVLPLLNYLVHINTVVHVYKRLAKQNAPEWMDGVVMSALMLMAVVLFCNAIWIMLIRTNKFDAESNVEEWMTLSMFVLLSAVDFMLMIIHRFDKTTEGRIEFRYFFGSLLFIDIPTSVGIAAIIEIVRPSISPDFGVGRFSVVQALVGGSLVMHIAVSQIVLVGLHLQRELVK